MRSLIAGRQLGERAGAQGARAGQLGDEAPGRRRRTCQGRSRAAHRLGASISWRCTLHRRQPVEPEQPQSPSLRIH